MLRLEKFWTWDFWFADDGHRYHIYFLKARRSLGDPDLRHVNASIGHATSADLTNWDEAADALAPAPGPAFDDLATWTGSVVRGPDGTWFMFYTGCTRTGPGLKQRIGLATSADLYTWRRHPASPLLESDPRWYEPLSPERPDEAWRDPWVFPDPGGDGWHMLLTARANHGGAGYPGVVGHARSPDLVRWQAQPPLSRPDAGFWHLEVPQVEVVAGRPLLMFSCLPEEMDGRRSTAGERGGVWCAPGESVLGPFDLARATPVTGAELYSGRLIRDRSGRWVMLAFRNRDADGGFIGEITDPMPVRVTGDGALLRAGKADAPGAGAALASPGGRGRIPWLRRRLPLIARA